MIATVTLNAAVDNNIAVEDFKAGQLNRAIRSRRCAGGKGINVSKIIKLLGGETVALGFLGGGEGKFIDETLGQMGIKTDFVWTDANTRVNIKLVDRVNRMITEINEAGEPVEDQEINLLYKKVEEWCDNCNLLVISGSLPPGVPDDVYYRLLKIASGKNVKTILDAEGNALLRGIEGKPYMIKPNVNELESTYGIHIDSIEKLIKVCRGILEKGVEVIVVSMDKDGAVLITNREAWAADSLKVDVVNTVGAGDALVAAFALGLERGYTLDSLMKYGIAVSAASISRDETILSMKEELEKKAQQVRIKRLF
jgi:1-phosphofructokinase